MAKILVVDDDPDFVEVTRIVLEANGYEVASAADGKGALASMRQGKPDLVLLDIMMAHILEGLEVSKEIQADTELRKTPVIMVSSITDSPHAGEFPTDEYLPVDDWISKPVQPADLLEKIKRCLR